MLKRTLILTAVLAVSSLALAQHKSRQGTRAADASPNATATCAATFTSGQGINATQYCVTKNGNITQFSRGDTEYIQAGDVSEGYGFCDATTNTRYFDYAFNDSGNLGAATFTSTATKAVSTRMTSDGIWQFTTTVTKVNANASGPGSAKVSMQIKNLTNSARTILVVRMADSDFLEGDNLDTNNDFDFTFGSAYGIEPGFRSGLSLTTNTFSNFATAFTIADSVGPDPCDLTAAPQPFVGDGSIAMFYEITVPKGATKTVNMTYKPI